jgi:hypothetical protein
MNYITLALSGGGLVTGLVMAILWGRARVDAEAYSGRLALAQMTILRANKNLAAAAEDAARAARVDEDRLAEIKRLEDMLAQHGASSDLLRVLGHRVLPNQGGAGPGTPAPVPGVGPGTAGKLGNH